MADFVSVFKSMDRKRWKILDGIFHFMWDYEYVPSEFIARQSKISPERVEQLLKDLSDKKLVHNKMLSYYGSSFTFTGLSLYSLWRLVDHNDVEMLGKIMGEGKESIVYNCISKYGEAVIKFHRIGHPSFRKVREKRDYGTFHYSVLGVRSAKNEIGALKRLYGLVHVPRPIAWEGNAVVMDLIDAKELYKVKLENPQEVLDIILEEVKEMYRLGVVHGDLSQYNILVEEEGVWFIDFPQFIEVDAEGAEDYLLRDLTNLIQYFSRSYGIEKDIKNALEYITES
ncbi:MAG: RIO1 family regulatory kinase/ATPase [Archaeoglobaceae archaeon]